MKILPCSPNEHKHHFSVSEAQHVGTSFLSLVHGQDLDTMEESSEIKVDTSISKTSWIQSYMAASGKRISKALSYITGEMKECGEGLKGKGSVRAASDPTPRKVTCGHPLGNSSPWFPIDYTEFCFYGLSKRGVFLLGQTYSLLGRRCNTCKYVGSHC